VVEIAAADDTTAFPIQELLAARCAITPTDLTTQVGGAAVPLPLVLAFQEPGTSATVRQW